MKNLLILFFAINNLTVLSQTQVFYDEFKDNTNKWSEEKRAYTVRKVKTGREMYLMKHKGGDPEITDIEWISVDFDSQKNFIINAMIYKEGGRTDYGYGLVWGGTTDNYYIYQVNGKGQYHIGKKVQGKWLNISDGWIYNANIDSGRKGYNEFTIKKKNNQYTFAVNGHDLATSNFEPFFGNKIGFVIHSRQKIMIDRIKISYPD